MQLKGPVRSFNTRRMYSENGQEIVHAVIQLDNGFTRVVAFIDRARGIDGVIDLHFGNMDLVDNDWVLRAYDDMHYRHGYEELDFLRENLK